MALVNRMGRLEEITEVVAWEKLFVFTPRSPSRPTGVYTYKSWSRTILRFKDYGWKSGSHSATPDPFLKLSA